MVVVWLLIFGISVGIFSRYLAMKYRHNSDPNHFEIWRLKTLKRDPSAEEREAREWQEKNPNAAPTMEVWLKKRYLKEFDLASKLSNILGIASLLITPIGGLLP